MCTDRCLGGGDGREGYFSPLFLFIGSLTTGRTAAAPPLSCLPRLPPLSPSAARRNSMPIRFGAQRRPDQRRGRGAGGSRVGEPAVLPPRAWAPRVRQARARVRLRRPRPLREEVQKTAWGRHGGPWGEQRSPAGHRGRARARGWRWFPGGRGL